MVTATVTSMDTVTEGDSIHQSECMELHGLHDFGMTMKIMTLLGNSCHENTMKSMI